MDIHVRIAPVPPQAGPHLPSRPDTNQNTITEDPFRQPLWNIKLDLVTGFIQQQARLTTFKFICLKIKRQT